MFLATEHHVTHKGEPFSLVGRWWQAAILNDPARSIVVMKSVQCGVSELLTIRAMAALDRGERVIWVLPTDKVRERFVAERIDTLFGSRYYRERLGQGQERRAKGKGSSDSLSFKQLGQGAITFVGSYTSSRKQTGDRSAIVGDQKVTEFVSDWAFVDEVDRCDQSQLLKVEDRLAGSKIRGNIRVSNPTIEGFGIDLLWRASDRKRWFVTCEHCGEAQYFDWFKNVVRQVDEESYELRVDNDDVACAKCGGRMNRKAAGEWVRETNNGNGDRPSGYHVSMIFAGERPIAEMFDAFKTGLTNITARQIFYNSALGLPFHHEGAKLYPELLDRIVGTYPQVAAGTGFLIGADPGAVIHYVVLDPKTKRVVEINYLAGSDKWSKFDALLARFDAYALLDYDYDTSAVMAVLDRHPGRTWGCSYRTQKGIDLYTEDKDARIVRADRTQSMDLSHEALVTQAIGLPRDARSVPGFYEQMCAPTRREIETQSQFGGRKLTYIWDEGNDEDHYRHAFNYAWLLYEMRHRIGERYFEVLRSPSRKRLRPRDVI